MTKLQYSAIANAAMLLTRLLDLELRMQRVLLGEVDMTIHGNYTGHELCAAHKDRLRLIAAEHVGAEMYRVQLQVIAMGVEFDKPWGGTGHVVADMEKKYCVQAVKS